MMKKRPVQSREDALNEAMDTAYSEVCPPMNRAERRSARGKLMVAQGQIAALKAKLAFLEAELRDRT